MSVETILEFFRRHKRNYQVVFSMTSPAAQYVLGDLQEFCCGLGTTMKNNDPLELARNEGRRQVLLRIQRAINLTPEQQFANAEALAKQKVAQ